MSEKILVPVLGESIVEATVSKWLKNEGDLVEADEPIVELETDKVNLEVPSPTSGVLEKINSKDGSVVEVGATLGSVSNNGVSSKKKVCHALERRTRRTHCSRRTRRVAIPIHAAHSRAFTKFPLSPSHLGLQEDRKNWTGRGDVV